MNRKQKLVAALISCLSSAISAADLEQTPTGFVWPLGRGDYSIADGGWLSKDPQYFTGEYHLGVDMLAAFGDPVYAIADGQVKPKSFSGWGDKNCAAVIEHKTHDGTVFTAIYGHLQCDSVVVDGSKVYSGKLIGKIGHWSSGDHVHFGVTVTF